MVHSEEVAWRNGGKSSDRTRVSRERDWRERERKARNARVGRQVSEKPQLSRRTTTQGHSTRQFGGSQLQDESDGALQPISVGAFSHTSRRQQPSKWQQRGHSTVLRGGQQKTPRSTRSSAPCGPSYSALGMARLFRSGAIPSCAATICSYLLRYFVQYRRRGLCWSTKQVPTFLTRDTLQSTSERAQCDWLRARRCLTCSDTT